MAGREAVEVRVVTVSWGYPPAIFHGYDASMEGTTDHVLLVDVEVGTLLRVAARLDGREFRIAELIPFRFVDGIIVSCQRYSIHR